MEITFALLAAGSSIAALAYATPKAWERVQLSRAKHPSLVGHPRMARRLASLLPFYEFDRDRFFSSDDAAPDVVQRRRAGFERLASAYQRFERTRSWTEDAQSSLSDLQFTGRYRVPYQYSRIVRQHLGAGSAVRSVSGIMVTDLDGNSLYDLTGSYGVNLFGHAFYKACIAEGAARTDDVGVLLGAYHPVVSENARRLREISGLEEVSFHMSGTEAVMQAVRLARFHTGRSRIVRFCGAYHGWWGEVQPGIGNPAPARDTITLAEMSERTLQVLLRRRDIACVLVNPLQALHPNANAPSDSALLDSSRQAGVDRDAYTRWLKGLRTVCTARGIVLVFDEVFTGFRLAPGGAQEYFGVRADIVTYGKTLGGGLPVGVVCGRAALMRRYRADRPGDICFARGTFNSHPHVMGAMAAFLDRLATPEIAGCYAGLDARWNSRAAALNGRLEAAGVPVRVANLSSIWTVVYTRPSRYNWMLQFYLRAEGLALSWIGTGRLIFSLDYTDEQIGDIADRFVAAAIAADRDGWWHPVIASNRAIRRRVLREVLSARLSRGARSVNRDPNVPATTTT